MNIEQEELDRWGRFANEVRVKMLRLPRLLASGQLREAREVAWELHLTAASVLANMEQAGVAIPSYLPEAPDVPLELLTSHANRRYAARLREALEAALEVDRERGYQLNGSASLLADRLSRVEMEVYGPEGRGEGS